MRCGAILIRASSSPSASRRPSLSTENTTGPSKVSRNLRSASSGAFVVPERPGLAVSGNLNWHSRLLSVNVQFLAAHAASFSALKRARLPAARAIVVATVDASDRRRDSQNAPACQPGNVRHCFPDRQYSPARYWQEITEQRRQWFAEEQWLPVLIPAGNVPLLTC